MGKSSLSPHDKKVRSPIMTHVITDLTTTPLTGDVDIATWPCHFATSTGRKFTSKLKKKEDHTYLVPQKFTNNSETGNCAQPREPVWNYLLQNP